MFAEPAMSRVRAIIGEVHDAKAPAGYTSAAALLRAYDVQSTPSVGGGATMFRAQRPTEFRDTQDS